MKKKYFLPLLLAALVLGPATRSEANLITNGSFEEVTRAFPSGQDWDYFSLGEVTGWTSIGAPVEVGLAEVYGVTGVTGNVLELDSTANAIVFQRVMLTAGAYELSFLSALRSGVSAASGTFHVLWNGAPLSLVDFTPAPTAMTLKTINVVATGGLNTLSFVGTGTSDSYGAIIGDVQLTSVPDGGVTAMLLGVALAGVGLVRRRMTM